VDETDWLAFLDVLKKVRSGNSTLERSASDTLGLTFLPQYSGAILPYLG
jgi:hypothetical protein